MLSLMVGVRVQIAVNVRADVSGLIGLECPSYGVTAFSLDKDIVRGLQHLRRRRTRGNIVQCFQHCSPRNVATTTFLIHDAPRGCISKKAFSKGERRVAEKISIYDGQDWRSRLFPKPNMLDVLQVRYLAASSA